MHSLDFSGKMAGISQLLILNEAIEGIFKSEGLMPIIALGSVSPKLIGYIDKEEKMDYLNQKV